MLSVRACRQEAYLSEPTVDRAVDGTNNGKPPERRAPKRWTGEGAFPRLQERTQTQLGFINNLLVTLAVGLLAFAVNASANNAELDRGWRKVVLLLGLVALTLSVLAGLRLAFNRLASHRITARVARIRQLRDRYGSEKGPVELRRLGRQAVFFETWARGSLTKRPEKQAVRSAAKSLAELVPDASKPVTDIKPGPAADGQQSGSPKVSAVTVAATRLVEALRSWYERADDATWIWLRWQTWFFIAGGLFLLVGPVSYYLFDHGTR
jgi:hypothetical protein